MSIIQEALKKAQSDVKVPDVRPDVKQVKKVEDVRFIVNPVAQKNGKKLAVKKNVLMAAGLSALVVIAIFSARQFLSKADNISSNTTQEVSYRPIIKPEVKTPDTIAGQGQLNTAIGIRKMRDRPNLVLNGIMYAEESPMAIVNNSIVEAGDSVSGAKVMKINRQSVILEYENVEITLNLK